MYRSRHTCFFHGTGFHGALLRWKARIAEPTIAPLDGLVALGLGFQKEESPKAPLTQPHGRYLAMYRSQHPSYDRLSGIGPGAGQRRTRPSPDANGLARAYPRQRIETRPPAVGSGDYVANPRFGIQRAHARAYGRLSGIGPGARRRRTRHSPDANGLAPCNYETRRPAGLY